MALTYMLPGAWQGGWLSSAGGGADADPANIDDPVGAPNDSDYNFRADSDQTGSFLAQAASPAIPDGATINSVTLFFRGARTAAGAADIAPKIRVNGTVYDGDVQAMSTSFADYTYVWTTNPETTVAWTKADVDGTSGVPLQEMAFRASNLVAGEEVRISQAYFIVDYTAIVEAPHGAYIVFQKA